MSDSEKFCPRLSFVQSAGSLLLLKRATPANRESKAVFPATFALYATPAAVESHCDRPACCTGAETGAHSGGVSLYIASVKRLFMAILWLNPNLFPNFSFSVLTLRIAIPDSTRMRRNLSAEFLLLNGSCRVISEKQLWLDVGATYATEL